MRVKPFLSIVVAGALALSITSLSHAIDLGGGIKNSMSNTTKGVARGAAQSEYNKKLSKEKCEFVGDSTTEYKGCNIDKIIAEMNGFRNAAEGSGFANDVDVEVMTYGSDWDIARKRGEFLRDKVRAQVSGSWDYNVRYKKAPSNEVYFQVKVN